MVEVPKVKDDNDDAESRQLAHTEIKTKQESTISTNDRQKTWQDAFDQGHQNDQHPSEVHGLPAMQSSFGIDFGDGQILTAKGLEKKAEAPEQKSITIGKTDYPSENVISRDWGATLKKGLDRAIQSLQHPDLIHAEMPPEGGDLNYPRRGREDDFIDYVACAKASKDFSALAKYIGEGPNNLDPDLIAATIRNEQFFFDNKKDAGPENYVQKHRSWPFNQDESLGPAQMQVQNMKHLAKSFPHQLGAEADAVRNGTDVHRAPYFVGAYFADVIQGIENKQKPDYISDSIWKQMNELWQKGQRNETLIIAYNPDPKQIKHVFTQLDNIKAPDWD